MMVTTSPATPAGKHRIQARPYSQPAPNKVICTCAVTLLPITRTAKNRRSVVAAGLEVGYRPQLTPIVA